MKSLSIKKSKIVGFSIILFALLSLSSVAQSVDFTKTNFPGKSKEIKEARKNFNLGKKYFDIGLGMYGTALSYFLKAQEVNPNNDELNYYIGYCYLKTVEKTKAIQYFERSFQLNPKKFDDIKFLMANAYQLNYEFDKSITLLKEYKQSLTPEELTFEKADIDKKIRECFYGNKFVKTPAKVIIENLGPIVNSKFPDYSPLINGYETVLFFTARRDNTTGGKKDNDNLDYYEDIYLTEKQRGDWTHPINPSKPLNTKFHDATVGLSPDGQTLLIYKGSNGGDICFEILEEATCQKPQD